MTSYLREPVPFYIFYSILYRDNGKLFRLEVWYSIYKRYVGTIQNYKGADGQKDVQGRRRKHGHISDRCVATAIVINRRHLPSSLCGSRRRRIAIGRRVCSIVGRRIKGETIVHQEWQRKVFYFSFTIFTTVYIIILIFIGVTFKFIGIIATVLLKGLLGMLGPFYNNSKGAKKGKESKQPIKLQSSLKLGDAILALTPVMLRTNNPQYIEDKGYKVYLPTYKEAISSLPSNRLLMA